MAGIQWGSVFGSVRGATAEPVMTDTVITLRPRDPLQMQVAFVKRERM